MINILSTKETGVLRQKIPESTWARDQLERSRGTFIKQDRQWFDISQNLICADQMPVHPHKRKHWTEESALPYCGDVNRFLQSEEKLWDKCLAGRKTKFKCEKINLI